MQALQVVQLSSFLDIVSFEVQYSELLQERNFKQFAYIVEACIQFFKLVEGSLYSLQVW